MKGRMRDKNGGKKKRLQKNWVYRYQKNLEERYDYDRRQCFIGYDLWYFYTQPFGYIIGYIFLSLYFPVGLLPLY